MTSPCMEEEKGRQDGEIVAGWDPEDPCEEAGGLDERVVVGVVGDEGRVLCLVLVEPVRGQCRKN